MKRMLCIAAGLVALAAFSGCCCGQNWGCGSPCGSPCGGGGYPSYQAGYAAPLGGSCGCGY